MKLKVNKEQHINDLNQAFRRVFPGLKLQFFHHKHVAEEGSGLKDVIKGNPKVRDLNPNLNQEEISIDGGQTVAELEMMFRDHLNLNVQVFRKMGASWLETTTTDSYSLDQQQKLSEESH